MPEFPDLELYLHALRPRVVGRAVEKVQILGPALLRTVDPSPRDIEGVLVSGLQRLGKRIVFGFENDLYMVVHLMIGGRFQWRPKDAKLPRKGGQAAFAFENGSLHLTEFSSRKRCSLHLMRGEESLRQLDAGGLEVVGSPLGLFRDALRRENQTVKRALTDPRLFSGIGNAYSDEILHRARLSPFKTTHSIDETELGRLHTAAQEVLTWWKNRLVGEAGDGFPTKVSAFRPEMAVHGKYGEACPDCGAPVQRVVYATRNEMNYCPSCQTEGRILADRSLSRLLRGEWPRTLEDLEEAD